MVVMVNRESCVRMKKYLDKELETIFNGQNVEDWSEVVITYEQNDIGDILDYKSKLRKKYLNMEYDEINRAIQDKFKKQENPKILIVTDMLITGFDAPILRVMYLDKPLYDHRLLQAIARVNRPYTDNLGEKKFGMVVDSVGLLQYVKKSIDSYEILAREDLQIDLLKNVFYDIDSRAKDFEENLKLLKNELKNLRYKDEDFSFDIDNLKEAYKRDSKTFKTHLDNLIPKIKRMVLYWDMISVMGKIHEVVEEFKALGPHKIRVKYEDDIAILNYIYLLIYKNIRGEVLPKEFWNGLIEIIHNKTIVKDFQSIVSYEINLEREIDPRTAIKILSGNPNEEKIADAYNILRLFLSKNISNPIYKVIYDRLEQIRKEWVKRNVDIETLKNKLKLEVEDVENYRKNIEGKSPVEIIEETAKYRFELLKDKLEIKPGKNYIEFEKFKKVLSEVINTKNIGDGARKKLSPALLGDLLNFFKLNKEIIKVADEVVDYALGEIKKYKG
jgi:type I restriction enzyme R subunit